MKAWRKRLHLWRSQRKLRSLAEWELTRQKGKPQVVLRWTLTYCLLMIPANNFLAYFSGDAMRSWQSTEFWGEVGRYLTMGFVMSLIGWTERERQYNRALREHQANAAQIKPGPAASPLDPA